MDGIINGGPGPAAITLTRTTKLDTTQIVHETGAAVQIEGDDGSVYLLREQAPGHYGTSDLNLDSTKRYRLRITAGTGKIYLSDFAGVNNNPPVDSISWKRENGDGLQLYINTHDPKNNTRYYQWKYDETWQIQSAYLSYLKYFVVLNSSTNVYSVGYRDSVHFSYDPNIINCWQYYSSSNLILGSTAQLIEDFVNLPLAFIPHGDVRMSVLYSINVKQYSWTKKGYEFMQRIKKNTESTGSVFDAQPSSSDGNIHCIADSTETVIGFFNICTPREKRIFIRPADVLSWGYYTDCKQVELLNTSTEILVNGLDFLPLTAKVISPAGKIITFLAAPRDCVDCTLRGDNKKPAYWP